MDLICIPVQSPAFDPDFLTNGFIDQGIQHCLSWAQLQNIAGFNVRVIRSRGRTPCIFVDIAASPGKEDKRPILIYSHLDRQPPLTDQWDSEFGPYTPIIKDDKLYGRGGADDSYGFYASILAIKAVQKQNIDHGRIVLLVETCEESATEDLEYYINELREQIGDISLVICLDSGAGDYNRLWLTTSLRGVISGTLTVKIMKEGVHSGIASGVIPSSFLIMRKLLDRLDNIYYGLGDFLKVDIPQYRIAEVKETAKILGNNFLETYPLLPGVRATNDDIVQLILAKTLLPIS